MLTKKIIELTERGYRIEFRPIESLFGDPSRIRIRLSKDDYNVAHEISRDMLMQYKDEVDLLLTHLIKELMVRFEKEKNNA